MTTTRYEASEKPGEVHASLSRADGSWKQARDVREFPTMERAEAWLRATLRRDFGRETIRSARLYCYGTGWFEFKPDCDGCWHRTAPDGARAVFSIFG